MAKEGKSVSGKHLGEEGTEQFVVRTRVDGKLIREQKIHDPFLHNRTTVVLGRWDAFKAIFRKREIVVQVSVDGSDGVMRAIMMLDPDKLTAETAEMLEQRRISRETSGVAGYCTERARA